MYDLTQTPNLKPFRQYNPNDVINLFAHMSGTVNKGTFVKVVSGDPDGNPQGSYQSLSGTPSRATSLRFENTWKVNSTTSGDSPLGMMLYDVREFNAFGERVIYRPRHESSEGQYVASGEAVPVLTRGLVEMNGFSGTPGPGSGAVLHPTVAGQVVVSNATTGVVRVGKFLSVSGDDGYAILKIEL
jgi:hypothetical protein